MTHKIEELGTEAGFKVRKGICNMSYLSLCFIISKKKNPQFKYAKVEKHITILLSSATANKKLYQHVYQVMWQLRCHKVIGWQLLYPRNMESEPLK